MLNRLSNYKDEILNILIKYDPLNLIYIDNGYFRNADEYSPEVEELLSLLEDFSGNSFDEKEFLLNVLYSSFCINFCYSISLDGKFYLDTASELESRIGNIEKYRVSKKDIKYI